MKKKYMALFLGFSLALAPLGTFAQEVTAPSAIDDSIDDSSDDDTIDWEEDTEEEYSEDDAMSDDWEDDDWEETEEETDALSDKDLEEAARRTQAQSETVRTVTGEISAISDKSITILTGTLTVSQASAAEAETEVQTEQAAADDTSAASGTEFSPVTQTLYLSTQAVSYTLSDHAYLCELAQTERISVVVGTAGDSTDASDPSTSPDQTAKAVDSGLGQMDGVSSVIEIGTKGLLKGDIVEVGLNEKGELVTLTILCYGTGNVDTAEEDDDIISENQTQ